MEVIHIVRQWLYDHPGPVAVIVLFGPLIFLPFVTGEKRVKPRKQQTPPNKQLEQQPERDVRPLSDAELRTLLTDLGDGIPMEVAATRINRTLSEAVRHIEGMGIFRTRK